MSSVVERGCALADDTVVAEPVVGAVRNGGWELVGNGNVANEMCGRFLSFKGCARIDKHGVGLDGVDYSGKVFVKIVHHFCNKPSCPVCFKSGWAVRQTRKAEGRLLEAHKLFGVIEHIVASVPVKNYGLPFEVLRLRAVGALKARGVFGGCLIPHPFRYSRSRGWYWSPHFHVLGFVAGGYGRCRGCMKPCLDCSGFEGATRRVFKEDSFIVKVLGERKTIGGTLWYQLNHAGVRRDVAGGHVLTWFGSCGYRKLKITVAKHKELCPLCGEELEKLHYIGFEHIPRYKSEFGYSPSFLADMYSADGRGLNWCVAHSGSYE